MASRTTQDQVALAQRSSKQSLTISSPKCSCRTDPTPLSPQIEIGLKNVVSLVSTGLVYSFRFAGCVKSTASLVRGADDRGRLLLLHLRSQHCGYYARFQDRVWCLPISPWRRATVTPNPYSAFGLPTRHVSLRLAKCGKLWRVLCSNP